MIKHTEVMFTSSQKDNSDNTSDIVQSVGTVEFTDCISAEV